MSLLITCQLRYVLQLFLSLSIFWGQSLVSSYTLTSYEIKDLQGSGSDFILETAAWTHGALVSNQTAVYTTCLNNYILGGYNVLLNNKKDPTYFQRVYENLPSHNTIYYTFDYYLIDSWDAKDITYFYFDDVKIEGFSLKHNTLNASKICGSATYADVGKINIYGSISHTASTLKFKIQPVTDELADNESFGFRNINLLFSSHPNPAGDIWCGRANVTLPNYQCACPTGPSSLPGSCPTCDASCASCFGTTKYDCFQCQEGYYFDGMQCSYCGDSCTTCEESESGILDAQEVCKECKKMVITYVEQLAVGHRYTLQLFPSTCDLSIAVVKENLRGSPISQDSFPAFSLEITKLSQNLYSFDLVLKDSLLKTTELNFTLHYLSTTATVPKMFIQSVFLQEVTKQVPTIQTVMAGVIGGSIAGTLLIGATGPLWTMISFQQFIRYFIYLNIDFPPQVEIFLQIPQPFNWSLIPNPFSYLDPDSDKRILASYDLASADYQPPLKFIKYHQSSFFIKNGATILLINISLGLALFIILIIKKISCFKNNSLLRKLKVLLRYNMIARMFLKNGIPLSLAVFLQLRLTDFSSVYLIQNNVLAIVSVIYIILMTTFLFTKLHRRDNSHLDRDKIRRLYGTLYQGMALKETHSKYYHFLIFFRGVLLVFLLTIPYKLPPLQIVPLIFCNLLLVYYLFGKAKFEDKIFDIINKVKEILIFLSEICILLLVLEVDSVMYYDVMGWIIVGVLGLGFITEFLYVIVLQIVNIGVMYKRISGACKSLFRQKVKPQVRAVTVRSRLRKAIKQ